jgi:two-component system response regulator PilR (NtrC family)
VARRVSALRFQPIALDEGRTELTKRIKWLLFLRVVILSFFLGAAALFHFFKGGGTELFQSLQIPLIAAYIISIGSALILPWIRNLTFFAHAQIDFDVVLITGIVHITGDIESPFPFLYNLAIVNSAILLFYRGAFITAGFSSLCYGGLLFWSHYRTLGGWISTSNPLIMGLTLNIPTFFIIASLSGFLARKLYETERFLKEKQKDYLDLEALKEALIQGVGSGVAITDVKGRINYFNAQAQSLTSLQEETVKGKKLTDIFPSLPYNFDGPREQKRVILHDFPYAEPNGRDKNLRLTLAPLSNPAQQPIGFVAIFEDITKQREMEEKVRLEEELRKARERELTLQKTVPGDKSFHFEGIVGQSGGLDKIYQLIQKVAATNTNVLITGESGTGKELVARAIHFNGPRGGRPFVAVNCGAIPEALMESELFGHVRGAFTGAVSDHDGLFKQADGGSIFLDEVGELPIHLQVKLLRVLQEKSFTPVGGSKQLKVDVRVISASNKDLRKELEKGRFREDLFYRLNVVQVSLPPLRNRKEDIPALTHYFIRKFATALNKQVEEISSEALLYLMNYSYPGNIRELENIIEHSVAVTNMNILTQDDLPPQVKGVPISEELKLFERTAPGGADFFFNKGMSLDEELATHEKCLLIGALKRSNGVQKRAAELLGINYRSFRHRLEKYSLLDIKGQGFREGEVPE